MPVKPDILKIATATQSRLFKIEAVDLRFSNGEERTYERLAGSGRGAVMIVPVTSDNEIILIREYAVGIEDYLLTLPKGLIDPGESPCQAADRELKEEAGFGSQQLHELKVLTTAPNYMGGQITLVIARDLYPCRLQGDEPEEMEVVYWPLAEIDSLIGDPAFSEGRAIAALYLTRDYLQNSDNR